MKKIVTLSATAIIFICMMFFSFTAAAEPEDPCTDPADPCPIDSNVILLIGAAIVVAGKKSYDYRKKALV